jgi:DNA-binding MarR family transcriptional regulator
MQQPTPALTVAQAAVLGALYAGETEASVRDLAELLDFMPALVLRSCEALARREYVREPAAAVFAITPAGRAAFEQVAPDVAPPAI